MAPAALSPAHLSDLLKRKLLFVTGKGGVGKTAVSQAIALHLSELGRQTLWVTFSDPLLPPGHRQQKTPNLTYLNCDPTSAFEEYNSLKIGISGLARIFLRNSLMRYLAKASPGVNEVVLMGKVWYETRNFEHVVVDMPSTGYGLAMFNSARNYAKLFTGGPVQKDAEKMLATFGDATASGCLVVGLPEEMPICESLELYDKLLEFFPANPSAFLVNKVFPKVPSQIDPNSDTWPSPVPKSASDYAQRRTLVEAMNLRVFSEKGFSYSELELTVSPSSLIRQLAIEIGRDGGHA